ncbi:hypothetical protein OG333_33405 [Streptomyces anulatus]|nr:hypothetical protein [Streptomyces sp. or20]WSV78966.1 hypothetical protein OG333_33405 [Streptomyces anulatus]
MIIFGDQHADVRVQVALGDEGRISSKGSGLASAFGPLFLAVTV